MKIQARHDVVTPSKLVSERGSNSIGVPIPFNAKPFVNIPSNSDEFPYVLCTEWLKRDYATWAADQAPIDSTHCGINLVRCWCCLLELASTPVWAVVAMFAFKILHEGWICKFSQWLSPLEVVGSWRNTAWQPVSRWGKPCRAICGVTCYDN